MSDYERVLLVKKEVFVYRIPPRQSNRGYRAADWNLGEPFWTGRLRVVSKGNDLSIQLEDKVSGSLFANCPVPSFPGIAVESVLDSSRYFVIRLMDTNGRTMFAGIGFAERGDSFDLNVALSDYFNQLKQEKEAEQSTLILASQPPLDLGLKAGQTIKLNLNMKRLGDASNSGPISSTIALSRSAPGSKAPSLHLPPPPPPASSRSLGGRPTGSIGTTSGLFDSDFASAAAAGSQFDLKNELNSPDSICFGASISKSPSNTPSQVSCQEPVPHVSASVPFSNQVSHILQKGY